MRVPSLSVCVLLLLANTASSIDVDCLSSHPQCEEEMIACTAAGACSSYVDCLSDCSPQSPHRAECSLLCLGIHQDDLSIALHQCASTVVGCDIKSSTTARPDSPTARHPPASPAFRAVSASHGHGEGVLGLSSADQCLSDALNAHPDMRDACNEDTVCSEGISCAMEAENAQDADLVEACLESGNELSGQVLAALSACFARDTDEQCIFSECGTYVTACGNDDECVKALECRHSCFGEDADPSMVTSCQMACLEAHAHNDAEHALIECMDQSDCLDIVFSITPNNLHCIEAWCGHRLSDCVGDGECHKGLQCQMDCGLDTECVEMCFEKASSDATVELMRCIGQHQCTPRDTCFQLHCGLEMVQCGSDATCNAGLECRHHCEIDHAYKTERDRCVNHCFLQPPVSPWSNATSGFMQCASHHKCHDYKGDGTDVVVDDFGRGDDSDDSEAGGCEAEKDDDQDKKKKKKKKKKKDGKKKKGGEAKDKSKKKKNKNKNKSKNKSKN